MGAALSLVCPMTKSSDVIRGRHKEAQPKKKQFYPFCIVQIPVMITGNGTTWRGHTDHVAASEMHIILEECSDGMPSQDINLSLRINQTCVEIPGRIQSISPEEKSGKGQWSIVRIEVVYEPLDELKWQRLKGMLEKGSQHPSISTLYGTLLPLDPAESLWAMKSVLTEPVFHSPSSLRTNVHDAVKSLEREDCERLSKPLELLKGGVRKTSISNESSQVDIPIKSLPVELSNGQGDQIRAYYDAPLSSLPADSPVVIIAPGYGETKREYVTLAYYLASNGFHVLRYDHTNHVGESDGNHLHTTLSGMQQDIEAVVNYVSDRWPQSQRGLVATSLSARVAIKTMAQKKLVELLVLITPIVDVQQTLLSVHQEDLVGNHQKGITKGVTNVLGFNVELDHWLEDACDNQYADLDTTIQDISGIQSSVVMVSAEHDVWVAGESTHAVAKACSDCLQQWFVIPGGLHRVLENPKKARSVYREIIKFGQQVLSSSLRPLRLYEPTRKAIGRQNKVEREQKQINKASLQLSSFWKDYLDHFHYIVNFSDYQQLLTHILNEMGPLEQGDQVLDAGCGNGNFGSFLLEREISEQSQAHARGPKTLSYVGIDFVPTALRHARERFHQSLQDLKQQNGKPSSLGTQVTNEFSCVDLNHRLPFKDGMFDKVVSNLVLGYLQSPSATIQELLRVLTPGGTLVFTNLKPNSDLSRIYNNFVQETSNTDEIQEAKQLLNNSGKIREAEGDGVFHFPDAEELEGMVQTAAVGSQTKIFATFANQAYIVVVKKAICQEQETLLPPVNVLKAA